MVMCIRLLTDFSNAIAGENKTYFLGTIVLTHSGDGKWEVAEMRPFFLVIMDDDRKEFAIEGPLLDDRSWNDAISTAQSEGRNIRCFNPGPQKDRDTVASGIKARFGYLEVAYVLKRRF